MHGVSASARTWWRVGSWFAENGWRAIAVDLRGHGKSPRAVPGLTLEDLAGDLRASSLELLGAGEKIDVLLGHSLGALAALELCAGDGERVGKLVLEEPPGYESADFDEVACMVEEDIARARKDPDAFKRQQLEENPSWSEGDATSNVASLRECDAEPVAALVRGLRFDLPGLVALSGVPTLLILGSEARGSALPEPERTTVASALREGTVEAFDAGHGVHRDDFEGYVGLLERWLGRPGA